MAEPNTVESPSQYRQSSENREILKWQRGLLPFTTRFLVAMAIAFVALSMFDLYEMRTFLRDDSTGSIREKIEKKLDSVQREAAGNGSGDMVQQSLLIMEADAIDKRYRQASALLMSRIWTRQLAFITGMVLAFIGAVFILSKLSEGRADVSIGIRDWKSGISSTSPGLVLAFFGTALMIVALIVQPKIEVQDRPVYFTTLGVLKNPDLQSGAQQSRAHGDRDAPVDPFEDAPRSEK